MAQNSSKRNSGVETMALAKAWLAAAEVRMPPIEQAKLWALREVLRKQGEQDNQCSRTGVFE